MTPIQRSTRARLCAREGCETRYDSFGQSCPWPARYCSPLCALKAKPAPDPKPRTQLVTRAPSQPKRRRPISEASPAQRAAVADRACVVCREPGCDPAHLVPRGLCADGDGDPRAVVPLCRAHHRQYDGAPGVDPSLDLLPYLEPHYRTELAFAVERFGLLSTLRRVTNDRESAAA